MTAKSKMFRLLPYAPNFRFSCVMSLIFLAIGAVFLLTGENVHTSGMYVTLGAVFAFQSTLVVTMSNLVAASPKKKIIAQEIAPGVFCFFLLVSYSLFLVLLSVAGHLEMLKQGYSHDLAVLVTAMSATALVLSVFQPLLYFMTRWAYFLLMVLLGLYIYMTVNNAMFPLTGFGDALMRLGLPDLAWILIGYSVIFLATFVIRALMRKMYRRPFSDWVLRQNLRW